MNWSDIFTFMTDRDPEFITTITGSNRNDINTCQRELDINFPASYVDFLLTMGVDTGRYHPFGKFMDSNFYRVLRQIPPEEYDIHDYFLIARDTVESRCPPYDLYLDMGRNDGHDAELVLAENGSEWAPEDRVRLTLLERLSASAWRGFDALRFEHNRAIHVHTKDAAELIEARERSVELLTKQGFSPSLPALERIICLETSTMTAITELDEVLRMAVVVVAGNDEKELGLMVELFLDNIPRASVDEKAKSIAVY